MLNKVIVIAVAIVVTTCWLAAVLPTLMPYLAELFVMALVARVVWFLTERRW